MAPRAFRGLRGDPDPSYDAIVIGGGVGGLVCANLLARDGLRVLLAEQHYMLGGYCSTFRRRGYTFDAATHFYPLLGNPSTITGAVLASLGVTTGWIKMDPVDHFHFPDGSRFLVPADFEKYLRLVKEAFPHEVEAIERFFALVREAYLYGLLYYFRGRLHDRLRPLAALTLKDVLDREFRDPKLRLLLAADCAHWGSPPSRTSFVFDSMLRLSYFLGNYYPEGGSQAFADELGRLLESRKGAIAMQAMVDRILVERGAAAGVEIALKRGSATRRVTVRAPVVISNADAALTCERLVGEEHVGSALIERMRSMRPTLPCFLVHLGVHGLPDEEVRAAEGYHWESWDAEDVATHQHKIFAPTLLEPRLAPPGGHTVILQKLTAVDYDRVQDWRAHKADIESDMMARLRRALPRLDAGLDVQLSASAFTSWRYTLNLQGAMLGWEMSPDQLGDGRPDFELPVRNLYLTGHWTRPGGGITPVIVSAMDVARRVSSAG